MSAQEAPILPRRKKRVVHAHHGGAWKVAYADFVTAMMAFFMVMWLLSQTDKETKQQLSEYFRTGVFSGAPSVLTGGSGLSDKGFLDSEATGAVQLDQAQLEESAALVKASVNALSSSAPEFQQLSKHVDVRVTDDGLLIQIFDGGDEFLFDLSSSSLKPGLVKLLEHLGPILSQLENSLQVHGHTDGRPFPTGSDRTNWGLSFDRADRARSVLESAGLRPGQISGVFAHGDTAPLVKDPLAPENRRLALLAVRRGFEKPAVPSAPKSQVL